MPNNYAMADTMRNRDTSLSHLSTSYVAAGRKKSDGRIGKIT